MSFAVTALGSGTAKFEVSPKSLEMFVELDIPFGVSVIVA